jgi:CHASE1-domain containing sensor protein
VTIVLVIALGALTGLYFVFGARKRAERRAVEAAIARRAARRNRVPEVSNNLKGATASQTIEPYKFADEAGDENQRAA